MKSSASFVFISLQWLAPLVFAGPSALQVPFLTNTSVGPDGPWNVIQNPIDFPDQSLYFFPSLTETSVIVPKSACQNQSSSCPLPLPPLYQQSGAQDTLAANDSSEFDASTWDNVSLPLDLAGSAHYIMDRITVDGNMVDGSGFVLADNFTVQFPGGSFYTQDVGFVSLNASGDGTLSWTTTSGSQHTANKTLPAIYASGVIPSISYGLHLGSAAHNVTGSLYLGGYDSSRCISPPLNLTSGSELQLQSLALNVSSGGSAYTNLTTSQLPFSVLPQGNSPIIRFEPGAPYMYLPRSVCDALAAHLPVTYDSGLNLYTWNNISDPDTTALLTSPHSLLFTLSSTAGGTTSIALPFTLLNLTLTSPIVSQTTQYFPCSPFSPPDGKTYILGRAFLQGAFLAQNWMSGTLWVAQAPGPAAASANVKIIQAGDSQIEGLVNAPSWESTWSGVLTALPADFGGSGSSGSGSGSGSGNGSGSGSSGLSAGAKAGIGVAVGVVGVAVIGAVVFWVCSRRRKNDRRGGIRGGKRDYPAELENIGRARYELGSEMRVEKPAGLEGSGGRAQKVQVPHQGPPAELDGG